MESLDPTGKEIYKAYIQARDAWVSYIRPHAIKKLNDYLTHTGKFYNKYEYYTDTMHGFMKDKTQQPLGTNKQSANTVAIYKKLSLLFHPDKFKHPSSSALFCQIKKWFDTDNGKMLDILDQISHIILEVTIEDDLAHLLANLANPDILDIIKSHLSQSKVDGKMENARAVFDLLNTPFNKLGSARDISNESSQARDQVDFLNTGAYKFFMDEAITKKEIDTQALTEGEIINWIREYGKYDNAILEYYYEHYRDNENILRAIVELQMQKNQELKKQNEELKAHLGVVL